MLLLPLLLFLSCNEAETSINNESLQIFPDYRTITVPVNIAPLNFKIYNKADKFRCSITDDQKQTGRYFKSRDGVVKFPISYWHKQLKDHAGNSMTFSVDLKRNGSWQKLKDFNISVSPDSIDSWLMYRLIHPQTGSWNKMGIYQRNLSNFKQETIVENSSMDKSCVNCHSVGQSNGDNFLLHIRAGECGGTVIRHNNKLEKISPAIYDLFKGVAYHWWHPSGDYIVFSANSVNGRDINRKSVHLIDGADNKSDLLVYDINEHSFYTDNSVFGSDYWESYPCWSADGKTIYYVRAKTIDARGHEGLSKIKYNLMKVDYDVKTHIWGTPTTVIDAVAKGRSIAMPRISPDGRYLVYSYYDYGIFPIFHKDADLWIYDLQTEENYPIAAINSKDTESYHSWSSNGRWLVYSSKQIDGEAGRPFIAYMNPISGKFEKGFVMPQKDPEFYRQFELSYNIPELTREKISTSTRKIVKTARGTAIPATVKQGPGPESYKKLPEKIKTVWQPS